MGAYIWISAPWQVHKRRSNGLYAPWDARRLVWSLRHHSNPPGRALTLGRPPPGDAGHPAARAISRGLTSTHRDRAAGQDHRHYPPRYGARYGGRFGARFISDPPHRTKPQARGPVCTLGWRRLVWRSHLVSNSTRPRGHARFDHHPRRRPPRPVPVLALLLVLDVPVSLSPRGHSARVPPCRVGAGAGDTTRCGEHHQEHVAGGRRRGAPGFARTGGWGRAGGVGGR